LKKNLNRCQVLYFEDFPIFKFFNKKIQKNNIFTQVSY
jgi:hypothetical protein